MRNPRKLDNPFLSSAVEMADALKMVTQHRHVHCDHYKECLNDACRGGWRGFTCSECVHQTDVPTLPINTERALDPY